MIKIIRNIQDVDFLQLIPVYEESNLEYGRRHFPDESFWGQIRCAEDSFREDISRFLTEVKGTLALWIAEGHAVAALRMEQYYDGMLISCLETAPKARGNGFATMLINHVIQQYNDRRIYVHIQKNNVISMKVHQKNGFAIVKDSARLVDGTVSNKYYTLVRN